jgi:predicted permease
MSVILDDLRMAVRRLWQQPGFSAAAIATLALGLGANITIFTLLHSLMLRALPVERPHELYRLGNTNDCCVNSGLQTTYSLFSTRLFEHLRRDVPGFVELAGFQANTLPASVRRAGDRGAASFPSQYVTANYFTMFGVRPAAGRLLRADDDRPEAPPVAVMSHQVWARAFAMDPGVIGGAFVVNGRPVTVVGIAAPDFFGDTIRPDPTAIWLPLGQEPAFRGAAALIDRVESNWLYAIGRKRADARPAEIEAAATAALQTWLQAQPFVTDANRPTIPQRRIVVTTAGGGVEIMRVTFSRSLTMLAITSGLVLLIACANLANLLLARADRGQAAIRAALGASSGRLMRQSMTEGVVLALAGALAGFIVAAAATRALITMTFAGATYVPVDGTPATAVWVFGFLLAIVTGALFSAAPAWAMSRTHPLDALHGVGRSGHERSFIPRRSLVIVQVALSMVLLVGAGLLGRSLGNLEGQTLGFDPEHRLIVRMDLPPVAGDVDRLSALYDRLHARLRQIPGVVGSTHALYSPMESNNWSSAISIDGRQVDPAQPDSSSWNRVGPDYFQTTGTRVVRGRAFTDRDTPGAPRVAVVNETFVQRFLEDGAAIGRRLGIGGPERANDFEIVGVVEDVKYTSANQPTRPMIFLPTLQIVANLPPASASTQARSTIARTLVLRTAPGARAIEGDVRKALADVDPDITVIRVLTHVDQVRGNFRLDRLMSRLLAAYGGLALALAALGLYGVTAYGVTRRTREIGIRMALGADRARIVRTIARGPILQTAIGIAIGLPLALVASRAVAAQLYGVSTGDPFVLGGAVVVLLICAALAAVWPALRAASVDPTQALR